MKKAWVIVDVQGNYLGVDVCDLLHNNLVWYLSFDPAVLVFSSFDEARRFANMHSWLRTGVYRIITIDWDA